MSKQVIWQFAVFGIVVIRSIAVWAQEPIWENIGDAQVKVSAVLVDARDPQNIFMGSNQGVFSSQDNGKNWRNVLSLKGSDHRINCLAYGQNDKTALYAATGNGLFYSCDKGSKWEKLFRGKSDPENDCRAVAVGKQRIYLGTKAGLFVSSDQGKSWSRQPAELGHSRIVSLAVRSEEPGLVYVASAAGLFRRTGDDKSWEKVFPGFPSENDPENDENEEDRDEPGMYTEITFVALEPGKGGRVYLSAGSGILSSAGNSKNWEPVTQQGLLEKKVNMIAVGQDRTLYAAAGNRVYAFGNNGWKDLSGRLSAGALNALGVDAEANLYAAGERGLFRSGFSDPDNTAITVEKGAEDIYPSISAIQRQAILFAEVDPDKIRSWRKALRKKAWMPKVSLGFNRDTSDLWHWESGSTVRELDDNLMKGRDSLEWDVCFSWDLGNMVWNEEQMNIDVRSRLSTQLRNDIVDEVTKIYFERIRVKSELEALDIWDKKNFREKELRIRELEAYLDGFTGGFFTGSAQKD